MQKLNFGRDLVNIYCYLYININLIFIYYIIFFQTDLQADIICLKKQLTIILDENHVLKVKIRRLENDMLKKNKYIDYLHLSAQKVY